MNKTSKPKDGRTRKERKEIIEERG